MSNITNFFVKHKDNIVITILIIGMFILSDSYDWEHMSKSAMREFDL